ncbi:MAG: PIN domain-containing protein [Cyanobacteriota bacterium]|nr:PIN domain-containing protein [Cyanobacteriota bacterium]
MSSASFRGSTIVDTGPLVAWFDLSDQDHAACSSFFEGHTGAFVSTWPVLTEVCHLIPPDLAPRFLGWVSIGGLRVAELSGSALELMARWMRQYGDLPMDLADASLLWLAHEHGLRRIATLDRRDVGVYRLPGGEVLENLLET